MDYTFYEQFWLYFNIFEYYKLTIMRSLSLFILSSWSLFFCEIGSNDLATTRKEEMKLPFNSANGPTGSRAGLFRTPISGGVHSATSALGLPPPALAVRNLMEQVSYIVSF